MQLSYLGHSSFRIKTKTVTIVLDPYSPKIGFEMPKVEADIVTISHNHDDHNFIKAVQDKPFIIDGPGEYEIQGVAITGLETYHDKQKGEKRGGNTIYVIDAEDLSICHLGDLGHELSSRASEEVGTIDVLLIPVGGIYTLDPKNAVQVIAQLEPKLVIPMHYKTPRHNQKFAQVEKVETFLKEMGVEKKELDKLVISKSSLSEELEVVVLKQKI